MPRFPMNSAFGGIPIAIHAFSNVLDQQGDRWRYRLVSSTEPDRRTGIPHLLRPGFDCASLLDYLEDVINDKCSRDVEILSIRVCIPGLMTADGLPLVVPIEDDEDVNCLFIVYQNYTTTTLPFILEIDVCEPHVPIELLRDALAFYQRGESSLYEFEHCGHSCLLSDLLNDMEMIVNMEATSLTPTTEEKECPCRTITYESRPLIEYTPINEMISCENGGQESLISISPIFDTEDEESLVLLEKMGLDGDLQREILSQFDYPDTQLDEQLISNDKNWGVTNPFDSPIQNMSGNTFTFVTPPRSYSPSPQPFSSPPAWVIELGDAFTTPDWMQELDTNRDTEICSIMMSDDVDIPELSFGANAITEEDFEEIGSKSTNSTKIRAHIPVEATCDPIVPFENRMANSKSTIRIDTDISLKDKIPQSRNHKRTNGLMKFIRRLIPCMNSPQCTEA
jgi:hypothetical protein